MAVTLFLTTLVVYVLAVARVTRLVNFDVVLDPLRIRIARRFGAGSALVYFLSCPWCVGFWLSLATAIIPVRMLHLPWWWTFLLALATSQLVGILAPLADDEDMDIETVESE